MNTAYLNPESAGCPITMPVFEVDPDEPVTFAGDEEDDFDMSAPCEVFDVDVQPPPPPVDETEAEQHRSTQEVCARLMKASAAAIDKAVANRPKHIQDLIDAPYEPDPLSIVTEERLAAARKRADELAERMRNPPPKPPPPPPLPPAEAEAKRLADFDADMKVIEMLMAKSAKFIEDAATARVDGFTSTAVPESIAQGFLPREPRDEGSSRHCFQRASPRTQVANRPQHIQDLMDGKVEWNPPSKQIAEECERNGDLTEGCVYNKMMDNFANNCPYHLLTQKGKTYDEMQAEFAANCPYHLIL